jgi:hypothetical protein
VQRIYASVRGAVHVGATLGRWVVAGDRHRRRGQLLSLAQCTRREAGGRWPSGPRAIWPVGRDLI